MDFWSMLAQLGLSAYGQYQNRQNNLTQQKMQQQSGVASAWNSMPLQEDAYPQQFSQQAPVKVEQAQQANSPWVGMNLASKPEVYAGRVPLY